MKFPLTIAKDYVPDWNIFSALREVVQNAIDSEKDGHILRIDHSGDALAVTSFGVKLDAKVWLMGQSGKRGGGEYIGQHGEGLKLACLVLTRLGHGVRIVNDDETWIPKIEYSEAFREEVLTIHTHKLSRSTGQFRFEISGISKEVYDSLRERFIALSPPKKYLSANHTEIITDEDFAGKVFVKGVFIQKVPELRFGYNFRCANTDRDRRMISDFDIRYYASRAIEYLMASGKFSTKVVLEMLHDGAMDTSRLECSGGLLDALVAEFRTQFGTEAIPVTSMAEAREVEHFGRRGIVVPERFAELLRQNAEMSLNNYRNAHRLRVVKTYGWHDMTDSERLVYSRVLEVIEPVIAGLNIAPVEPRLNIVDFAMEELSGTFDQNTGAVKVARKTLVSIKEFTCTLVHEVAHIAGGDGDVGHERMEGEIFSTVIENLMNK